MCCPIKHAKEIWDNMDKKYILEDIETKQYAIGNFKNFQMIEDRDVSSDIHVYHMLINDLANEDI